MVPKGAMGPSPLGSEGDIEDPRLRIVDSETPALSKKSSDVERRQRDFGT